MAKISARGCVKLAAASKFDGRVKTRLALRSDGSVLRALDVAHDTGYPSRGGYSIIGKVKDRANADSMRAAFVRYCTQRGFEVAS